MRMGYPIPDSACLCGSLVPVDIFPANQSIPCRTSGTDQRMLSAGPDYGYPPSVYYLLHNALLRRSLRYHANTVCGIPTESTVLLQRKRDSKLLLSLRRFRHHVQNVSAHVCPIAAVSVRGVQKQKRSSFPAAHGV